MIGFVFAMALAEPSQIAAFGIGQRTCATALAADKHISGYTWVMGYFTGINAATDAQVGHTTDGYRIVAEVEALCRDEPALQLIDAAERVYIRMRDEGR